MVHPPHLEDRAPKFANGRVVVLGHAAGPLPAQTAVAKGLARSRRAVEQLGVEIEAEVAARTDGEVVAGREHEKGAVDVKRRERGCERPASRHWGVCVPLRAFEFAALTCCLSTDGREPPRLAAAPRPLRTHSIGQVSRRTIGGVRERSGSYLATAAGRAIALR